MSVEYRAADGFAIRERNEPGISTKKKKTLSQR